MGKATDAIKKQSVTKQGGSEKLVPQIGTTNPPGFDTDHTAVVKGSIFVNRQFKEGRDDWRDETDKVEPIQVPAFAQNAAVAEVSFEGSMTKNMGNFESVRVAVGVRLPCYVTEINEAFETAKRFCEERLALYVQEANEAKAKLKK